MSRTGNFGKCDLATAIKDHNDGPDIPGSYDNVNSAKILPLYIRSYPTTIQNHAGNYLPNEL
jgi:hypothetical protein